MKINDKLFNDLFLKNDSLMAIKTIQSLYFLKDFVVSDDYQLFEITNFKITKNKFDDYDLMINKSSDEMLSFFKNIFEKIPERNNDYLEILECTVILNNITYNVQDNHHNKIYNKTIKLEIFEYEPLY